MIDLPQLNMGEVAGLRSANRRLARLGVENVDLSYCEHGHNAECEAQVGRTRIRVRVHGRPDPVAAVDALVDEIERRRSRAIRRRRR